MPSLALLACAATLGALLSFPARLGLEAMRVPSIPIGFNGMFILDAWSVFAKVIFLLGAMLTILVSRRYLAEEKAPGGEYYALILFAVVGMMFLASAGDFVAVFVALGANAGVFFMPGRCLERQREAHAEGLAPFLLRS